jgi:histidine triad (HIT) family protein
MPPRKDPRSKERAPPLAQGDSCLFCKLATGKGETSYVYSDDKCAAFMDIQPINPGHVLIVPRSHYKTLEDVDPEAAAHLMKTALKVGKAIHSSEIRSDGINLLLASGEAAGQEVQHFHLHVIPRFPGDGFGLAFGPDYGERPARHELDRLAALIRAQL